MANLTESQIKAQISALQHQLENISEDIQTRKLNAFGKWMVTKFGRELKVGDVLVEEFVTWQGPGVTERERRHWKVVNPKGVGPYNLYDDMMTDTTLIYWGHANLAVHACGPRGGALDNNAQHIFTKTGLRSFKLKRKTK